MTIKDTELWKSTINVEIERRNWWNIEKPRETCYQIGIKVNSSQAKKQITKTFVFSCSTEEGPKKGGKTGNKSVNTLKMERKWIASWKPNALKRNYYYYWCNYVAINFSFLLAYVVSTYKCLIFYRFFCYAWLCLRWKLTPYYGSQVFS